MKQRNLTNLFGIIFFGVIATMVPLTMAQDSISLPLIQKADEPVQGLTGEIIIDTGPFYCEGEQYQAHWKNESEQTLYIRQAEIWMGMDVGGVADYWVFLSRLERPSVLGHTNWDHYADPTTLHMLHYNYAPDAVTLRPGETLELRYGCSNLQNGPRGHVTVTIWYL